MKTEREKKIDALIPHAEREADAAVAEMDQVTTKGVGTDGAPYEFCRWTEIFHKAMDKLAKAEGLRV